MGHSGQYTHIFMTVEKRDYNAMISGESFFDQPVKNALRTYHIRKILTGQEGDYITGYSLYYDYFKENYNLIVMDVSKQQALDADPKVIQQINFTRN